MNSLTKREKEIMDILWNSSESMAASEIQKNSQLSIYTIQQVLRRLLSMGMIEVAEISQNKKALMRKYAPAVSQGEFLAGTLSSEGYFTLASSYVKSTDDRNRLQILKDLIDSRLSETEE